MIVKSRRWFNCDWHDGDIERCCRHDTNSETEDQCDDNGAQWKGSDEQLAKSGIIGSDTIDMTSLLCFLFFNDMLCRRRR